MADDGLLKVNVTEIQEAESAAFADQINKLLRHDDELKQRGILPITEPTPMLVLSCRDGKLLSRMINVIKPGVIPAKSIKMDVDVRKLKVPGAKDAWEIANNNNKVLEGAKALGCKVVNIGHEDILEGNVDLILGLVWQLIRAYLMRGVNLSSHPELIRLLKPNENILKLMNLSAEELIMRWFNYHLARAGSAETVKNFGNDMKDCSKWVTLLKQVCPREAEAAGIDEVLAIHDPLERAQRLLDVADELDCCDFTSAKDIVKGHARLNLAFTATIFNEYIGIRLPTEDEIESIYEQLEQAKVDLAECREGCAHKAELIRELEKKKAELQAAIAQLERELEEVDTKAVVKESEIAGVKREAAAAKDRLAAVRREKELALKELQDELEAASAASRQEEADKKRAIAEQMKTIEVLEKELAKGEAEKRELSEQLEGRGAHLAAMTDKLLTAETACMDKTRAIADHVGKSRDMMQDYGSRLRNPVVVSVADDEQQALQDSWKGLEQLITGYILEINESDAEFTKERQATQQRLEDLNQLLKSVLGDAPSDPVDGVLNLKRLLELMIEKCSKQGTRIATLENVLQKKEALYTVYSQKIAVIAEQMVATKEANSPKPKKSGIFSFGSSN